MKTFIIVVMLCHLDYRAQEVCIPMVQNPPVYYSNEQQCNEDSMQKRKDMAIIGKENNLIITGTYSTCVEDKSKSPA